VGVGPAVVERYVPIVIHFTIAVLVALGTLLISRTLSRKRPNPRKYLPYESGIIPEYHMGPRFSVKFYLVAMLFMIFDVEGVSFYPWAVILRRLGSFGLWEMLTFVIVLGIGYAYVWKRGGFQWDT
jgi:NADH-quinone oxidoreductase subunit A